MKALYIESGNDVIHTEEDLCLFLAPRKMADGRKSITGKDLFVHKTRGDKEAYYVLHWFLKPVKRETIVPVSPVMAEKFLEQRGIFCNSTDKEDLKAVQTMQRYGWGMLEEF